MEVALLTLVGKIDALMSGITRADTEKMPPAHRLRIAEALRRVAEIADPAPRPEVPRAGVLADLRDGQRVE
jgi:hypothetical protein